MSDPAEFPVPSTVLVVDDEPSICYSLERLLTEEGCRVLTASSAEDGLSIAGDEKIDLVMLDVRLPKADGIESLPRFTEATGHSPVIIMTAFGDLETAVAAVKRGAREYLVKPFRLEQVRKTCRQALMDGPSSQPAKGQSKRQRGERLIGQSAAMQQVFRQIALVAESDLAVLITGETGTGKELVASAIWKHGSRADQVYLPISPVALNPDLIESELFGHVKGSFTGATEDRAGLFEQAEGGTVLLDEIGELSLAMQVKLLRVLEQGHYMRVGDVAERRCDVRVIAATNCNLHAAVQAGTFREDLYYRLNGLHIHLPPLRDRKEDLRSLCEYFLQERGVTNAKDQISDDLLEVLGQRPWHGNIRELRNAVDHAAVVARGRSLQIEDFPPAQPVGEASDDAAPGNALTEVFESWIREQLGDTGVENLHATAISKIEPVLFRMVLDHTGNNRAKAAELLGIHRGTLREKLRQYGLDSKADD